MRTFTHITSSLGTAALALALLAQISVTSSAHAQYTPTGKDGITASPRVRQQLDERKAPREPVAPAAVTCANCKDVSVAQRITEPNPDELLCNAAARHLAANKAKLLQFFTRSRGARGKKQGRRVLDRPRVVHFFCRVIAIEKQVQPGQSVFYRLEIR